MNGWMERDPEWIEWEHTDKVELNGVSVYYITLVVSAVCAAASSQYFHKTKINLENK